MHLIIRTDGRTERAESVDPWDDRCTAWHSLAASMGPGFTEQQALPIPTKHDDGTHGRLTLWIGEPTLNGDAGLRNLPASLLAAQWGVPARVLCGPVVVTSTGNVASAFVEDLRWAYVESLTEDIVRAINGLPVTSFVDRAWPDAIRLAAAVLTEVPRPHAAGLTGKAAVDYLMAELGFAGGGR